MLKRTALIIACLVMLFLTVTDAARADQWDKKTTITFSQYFRFPG